jgi:hypothetical protein
MKRSGFYVRWERLADPCPPDLPPQAQVLYEGLRMALLMESATLSEHIYIQESWFWRKVQEMKDRGSLTTKQPPFRVFAYYKKSLTFISQRR